VDWLTFISNLIGSLAWPAAACVVALLFRSQISTLFKNLNKLKWRDMEAQFGEKVDQIREEVREIEDNPNFRDEPVEPKLIELAETHPHLAVLEAWKQLERSIIDLSVNKLGNERRLPITRHLDELVRAQVLPPQMAKAVRDIREVRNQSVPELDTSLSKGRAYVLIDTIADIVGFLNRVTV